MDASTLAAATSLSVYAQCEFRAVIRLLHVKSKTPISLHRKLCEMYGAIQNRRRGMLTKEVCLIHDNVRPHVARDTKVLLDQFSWDVISHSPYSSDLDPSDYHLFLNLKEHLSGKRMETDEEVRKRSHNTCKRR